MFVVGFKRSNSTPAMVESAGIVSLEMMKIGTATERLLIRDDDQSCNIKSTEKSHQLLSLHTDQNNDLKSTFVDAESSKQTTTNNSPCAAHMGERFSPPCSYTTCPLTISKFGKNSICSEESKISARSNVLDISCSLPSLPVKQLLKIHGDISNKSTSNFELTKQCYKDDSNM